MDSLADKVVLVAGGAGGVGEGIVRGILRAGGIAVAPSRSAAKLEQLRANLGNLNSERLFCLEGQIGNPAGAEQIRDQILARYGRVDAVVVTVGGWWQGLPLPAVPWETWQRIMDDNLGVHFVVQRTFIPVLVKKESAAYIMLNGFPGEEPYPRAAPISIASAGLIMMARALALEVEVTGVRINQLILGPVATRFRVDAAPNTITADELGDWVAGMITETGAIANGSIIRMMHRPEKTGVH